MQIVMLSGSRNREGRTARAMAAIGKVLKKPAAAPKLSSCPNLISKGAVSVKKTAGASVRPSTAVLLTMTLHLWSPN